MSNILSEMVANKHLEIEKRKASLPVGALQDLLVSRDRSFERVLAGEGIKLIAEIKPASPSSGRITNHFDLPGILRSYSEYADAISVLTDRRYFDGSLALLQEAARLSSRPALCKDFIVDAYQVYEARCCGADAVLLIVKILEAGLLRELKHLAESLSMTAVIEVQSEKELETALAVQPSVILINNRNLTNLQVDLGTTRRLSPLVPRSVMLISASGIRHRRDVDDLLPFSSRFLVGTALMQSDDPGAKLRHLKGL